MQTSTKKVIKNVTRIIIQLFLLVVSRFIMGVSLFIRAFHPDLGGLGFGVCIFFCIVISIIYSKTSRIFWFIHITLMVVYLMCFVHVSMLW